MLSLYCFKLNPWPVILRVLRWVYAHNLCNMRPHFHSHFISHHILFAHGIFWSKMEGNECTALGCPDLYAWATHGAGLTQTGSSTRFVNDDRDRDTQSSWSSPPARVYAKEAQQTEKKFIVAINKRWKVLIKALLVGAITFLSESNRLNTRLCF